MTFINQLNAISFTTQDNLTLRGWATPLRKKPIIVFCHANGFSSLTYNPLLAHLANDFDLVMLDAQAHGDSDRGHDISWKGCAQHVLEFVQQEKTNWVDQERLSNPVPVYALGHSFGAVTTLLAAAQQEQLFDRMILMDPVIFSPVYRLMNHLVNRFKLNHKNPIIAGTLKRRQQWPNRKEAYNSLRGRGIFKGWDEPSLWAYINHALIDIEQGVKLKCAVETEATLFEGPTGSLWPSIKRLNQPTTIISGDSSYAFVTRSAKKAKRTNAAIDHIVVAGGHCFMQEQPEQTAKLISKVFNTE